MDPMTLKQLGEWRLEALRRDARCRDGLCEAHCGSWKRKGRRVARVAGLARRAIGGALVYAGLRVLGDQGA